MVSPKKLVVCLVLIKELKATWSWVINFSYYMEIITKEDKRNKSMSGWGIETFPNDWIWVTLFTFHYLAVAYQGLLSSLGIETSTAHLISLDSDHSAGKWGVEHGLLLRPFQLRNPRFLNSLVSPHLSPIDKSMCRIIRDKRLSKCLRAQHAGTKEFSNLEKTTQNSTGWWEGLPMAHGLGLPPEAMK